MDTYFTLEERYIQAVEEARYGEAAKALKLFNDLLEADPGYARTYYQLGYINYYYIHDYQTAGYYFNRCIELEPHFPDVYNEFTKLLLFLNRDKHLIQIAEKALKVAGVNKCKVYKRLALMEERNLNYQAAINFYRKAFVLATSKQKSDEIDEAINRVRRKQQQHKNFVYSI